MRAKFEVTGADADTLAATAAQVAESLAAGRHVRSIDLEARPLVVNFKTPIPQLWVAEVEAEIAD